MLIPNRRFNATDGYRYGFNGKENDNEIKGEGNQQDYGFRVYDPRVGKFLSEDPITKKYPHLTPYQFSSNNPIQNIDIDGLEGTAGMMASPGKFHIPGDANDDGSYSKSELKQGALIMGATTLFAADMLLTRGKGTQTVLQLYTFTQIFNSYEHNVATTPEGRAEQRSRTRGALSEALITWGIGRMAGAFTSASARAVKLVTNRFNFAKDFYKSAGYKESEFIDEIAGIDLNHKVFETTLKKGTKVEQWLRVDKATGETIPGNYYILPGTDPTKIGVSLEGRVKVTSVLDEDTKFLQSTAADVKDTWTVKGKAVDVKGGETQLFKTKVKATKIKEK